VNPYTGTVEFRVC